MNPRNPTVDGLDVYLFPAVVGGGVGDIEEVLLAGRRLSGLGFRSILFRSPGRPLPRAVDGPWGWPALLRTDRPVGRAPRAMTISAWWGVSAAPAVDAPYGRAGPWSAESDALEARYGRSHLLHVSFEEFARTLTSRAQTRERWREGGLAMRQIRPRLRTRSARTEAAKFRKAFRRFRAFERPNVLHLYPTFVRSAAFQLEFPEAVQTGPFWPEPPRMVRSRQSRNWVWYASPGSSPFLAQRIASGWRSHGGARWIEVRASRPFPTSDAPGLHWRFLPALPRGAWLRRLARAELRIVTGSRTLLEALVLGRPFLYFNGVLGSGRSRRRHRPEKIESLLALWRRRSVPHRYRRDLAEFSRARSVGRILDDVRRDPSWARGFPRGCRPLGFVPPYDDAGGLLVGLARAFASGRFSSEQLVRSLRSGHGVPSEFR